MASKTANYQKRVAAGACTRCGHRPRVEGVKTCAVCREKMRELNKRRRAAKHAWEMRQARALGVLPQAERDRQQAERRAVQIEQLHAFAREHGFIPSLPEVGALLGIAVGGQARRLRALAFPGAVSLFTPLASGQRITFDEVYLNAR